MSKLMELVDDLCNACHYRAIGVVAHGREEALAAVEAAVAELERIEKAARDYATRYVQDEADDVRNCFNERQHEAAKELIEALSAIAPIRVFDAMEAAHVPER